MASQLVSCAPTYQAKLYAASQAFDEARHVEAFSRYIQERSKLMYPVGAGLKSLLDKILTDERWDLKLIGMQIIIEGLALAAFNTAKAVTPDPVLRDLLHFIIRDEAKPALFENSRASSSSQPNLLKTSVGKSLSLLITHAS